MRAETAGGLDLWKLENLKIFNGYEIQKERKLSFEGPSSPEDNGDVDDSDGQQGGKSKGQRSPTTPRNKCGRPANPIPRHKRHSHIKAEYKRRDKIQKCFDSLITLVPSLAESSSSKESKSAMLFKTAEYGRRLKAECVATQSEKAALLEEIESLGTEIQDLQLELPQHGAKTAVDVKPTAQMDNLYDAYVQTETRKNWKFWIFGFFMQPLYLSYCSLMSSTMTHHEFTQKTQEWVQDTLSLTSLRKGFLSALRKVSTQTGIMTAPGQLEQEARSKVHVHCIQHEMPSPQALQPAHHEMPSPRAPQKTRHEIPSPRQVHHEIPSPRQAHHEMPSPRAPPAPSSRTATPVVSPAPTPPRTPTMRKHSFTEPGEPRCKSRAGSRSRSNTPPSGDTRQRKRSNKRSEKRIPSSDMTTEQPSKLRLSMPNNTHGVAHNTHGAATGQLATGQLATIGGNTITCPTIGGNTVTCPIVSVQYVPANLITGVSGGVPAGVPGFSSNTGAVTLAALLSGQLSGHVKQEQVINVPTPSSTAPPAVIPSVPSSIQALPPRSACVSSCLPTPHSSVSHMDEAVITTFIESLISESPTNVSTISNGSAMLHPMVLMSDSPSNISMQHTASATPHPMVLMSESPSNVGLSTLSAMSQPMVTCTDTSSVSLCSDVIMTCTNGEMPSVSPDVPMSEHTSKTVTSSMFLPVDQGSIITNNTLIPHNFLAPSGAGTFHSPMPVDSVLSYDVMETSSHGDSAAHIGHFTPFSSAISTMLSDDSTVNSMQGTFNNHCHLSEAKDLEVKSHPLNTDEDSLMKMLSFDVMDVNSVMSFLDSDQVIPSKTGFGSSNIS